MEYALALEKVQNDKYAQLFRVSRTPPGRSQEKPASGTTSAAFPSSLPGRAHVLLCIDACWLTLRADACPPCVLPGRGGQRRPGRAGVRASALARGEGEPHRDTGHSRDRGRNLERAVEIVMLMRPKADSPSGACTSAPLSLVHCALPAKIDPRLSAVMGRRASSNGQPTTWRSCGVLEKEQVRTTSRSGDLVVGNAVCFGSLLVDRFNRTRTVLPNKRPTDSSSSRLYRQFN